MPPLAFRIRAAFGGRTGEATGLWANSSRNTIRVVTVKLYPTRACAGGRSGRWRSSRRSTSRWRSRRCSSWAPCSWATRFCSTSTAGARGRPQSPRVVPAHASRIGSGLWFRGRVLLSSRPFVAHLPTVVSTHVRRVSIVAEQLLRLLHHCGAPTTDVDLVREY